MDRNREARRTTMAANGLSRRRHRSNSLRDSPEEDGPMELQEPSRLRDRGSGKKDRDRERDRDRDRERDRDRSSRSKRRRGDRLMHSHNREDGGDDISEESVNDDEEDEDDDVGGGSIRMLPLNPSSSVSNHRKSFHPAKDFRAPPTWKAADEMIGVSVPRKARSASTKRLHECWASNGGIIGEQFHRQASTSPVRTSATAMGMGSSPSPASPSFSNASGRKKMKPSGPTLRPPKSSSKSFSAQDGIEIEIAEVLYGMMRQPQGISKQETTANDLLKSDSKDMNKSYGDGKSWVSSPISNSQSAPSLSPSVPPQNSRTSITILSTVAAPKRKRPRHFMYEDENPTNFTARNSPMLSTTKAETDQPLKLETCSPNFDKNVGSAPESGGVSLDLDNSEVVTASSEPQTESIKFESNISADSKPVTEGSERQDAGLSKEEPESPKNESTVPKLEDDQEDVKATKANPIMSGSGNLLEEKLKIDLMAPPPSLRSSPERDVDINAENPEPLAVDAELDAKAVVNGDHKSLKMNKDAAVAEETEKHRGVAEEADTQKPSNIQKDMSMSLQLDLEKVDKDIGNGNMVGKRHQQHAQRQQQQQQQQQPNVEIAVQSSSVPLPLSVPSWPGGLSPMGYMTPLQGVVSKDGTTVSSAAIPPPHLLFNQPRPKRCATHCDIARTISYHQQIARMNPFWPAAAGSASLYGAKPCNLNVVSSTEFQGNVVSRAPNSAQDKGHSLAMFPGPIGKEKGSQAFSMESAQRKQMLHQQALPPGAPSNILHGPAFIFPLNQQQAAAAAAASVRPGSVKSLTPTGNVVSSSGTSNAIPAISGAATAPPSFSYPNMSGNDTQYLAILQNNAYPFTIPAHVGGSPAYRGTHAQALPFFNGSFYSSQMIHPSQLQQQQLPGQSQQNQQGHQNASMSSGSSSSQKRLQNQQQKPNASGSNGGVGLQGFPTSSNNQPSQSLQLQQQRQHLSNHHASHPSRLESDMCGEDSPSTADSWLSRASMSIYGHNFAMPMQPPNFAMMTPAAIGAVGAATVANGSHSEKQQQQHSGTKAGIEASQAFAMSFASVNGATTAPGLDLSSIAQNQPILRSHNFQIMAAQPAHQTKNYRVSEEGKTGDSSNPDGDRKAVVGKVPANVGQSIAFSRQDASDPSISAITGNSVLDSCARTLNLGSAPSVMPAAISTSAVTSQQQLQRSQQQQPQIIQIQKHQQFAAAAARSKTPSISNGSVYSDCLPAASSAATKFTNSVSAYPQNLSQSSSTAAQSPQWKNSVRPTASQSLPSMAPAPSAPVKTVPQQQVRSQQAHTHISFAVNAKSSPATQGQLAGSTHSSSPPVMVASPTTSSMSKNACSPRTTSTSTGNKVIQASSLSTRQAKNSQAVPSRKSSPIGGRNVPSILSGPQLTTSSSSGIEPKLPQQQQPQQISKQISQPAQLFFSNAYMHPQGSQPSGSTSTASAASGYYLQRRALDPHMQGQSSSGSTSGGMLSLCPAVTIINTSSTDSSKVAAATANNMKGSGLPTHGFLHPAHFAAAQSAGSQHQYVHTSFSYAVPAAIQVKPAEQKQPAGE